MSTNETKPQESSGKDKDKGAPTKRPARTGLVAIDYRGSIGRALESKGAMRDQKSVPHRLSPLTMFWPENGTPRLRLHPGVNLVDATLWDLYVSGVNEGNGHPQLKEKIERKMVREIKGLPEDFEMVESMIARTIDHEGLRWMEKKEREGQNRPEVLTMLADRLAKARPVVVRNGSYQGRVPNLRDSDAKQPSLAMG